MKVLQFIIFVAVLESRSRLVFSQQCDDSIPSGTTVSLGTTKVSCKGCFRLILQNDGNLVSYRNYPPYTAVWTSNTNGRGITKGVMEQNGQFNLYTASGVYWSTTWSVNGTTNARIMIQDDAQIAIWENSNSKWVSGKLAECSTLR